MPDSTIPSPRLTEKLIRIVRTKLKTALHDARQSKDGQVAILLPATAVDVVTMRSRARKPLYDLVRNEFEVLVPLPVVIEATAQVTAQSHA